jgi:DNA-binding response OmpR family regulator
VANGQRVLVVDGLSETEEVLKAVLEPRGLKVDRIRTRRLTSSQYTTSARANTAAPQVQVVVLHEEEVTLEGNVAQRDSWGQTPRVIIGSAKVAATGAGEHYLQKPFQYRELIQAIERLLEEPPADAVHHSNGSAHR